jgi:hypothetical protein
MIATYGHYLIIKPCIRAVTMVRSNFFLKKPKLNTCIRLTLTGLCIFLNR